MHKYFPGIGMIESNTVIDTLAIKSYVGNKIFQGRVSAITSAHKESSLWIVDWQKKEETDIWIKCIGMKDA